VATVSTNDPRSTNNPSDKPVQLRLKEQQETATQGPGLAARRHQSWASRFERGQGGSQSATASVGWEIFSYLLSGMLAYGGIGWIVGHFVHIGLLFPIGMGVGLAIALGWVIYRYGRAGGDRAQ